MKKFIHYKFPVICFIAATVVVTLYACKKDKDGSPDTKAGNPVATSLTPSTAAGGTLLTLTGTGLGQMQKIVFDRDSVPAPFYSTLNTESAVVFRVPDTISGGPQNIVLTNSDGKTLLVPFTGLAYPKVLEVSDYGFAAGTNLELTGVNLEDVNKVVIEGTTDAATIVSKSKKKLVIAMPATSIVRAKLAVSNPTGTTITTHEFVYKPNNFIIFDDDFGTAAAYGGNIQSWSWDCNPVKSTSIKSRGGAAVMQAEYTKANGGLSLFLGCNWKDPNSTFNMFFPATFLTFWAYTEGDDAKINIMPDGPWSGPNKAATASGKLSITVPKGKWTYFRLPVDFIKGDYSRLNLQIDGGPKTVYFDEMLMVK
ncbi:MULTISPECIES: IPT/TIG domain-containing protein [Niastella]|uniref:IPT/TIG domain-containing protein n=1 Tax=Niastella soli TaxID=2821487 RepID=A0ABS3YXR1_9BACT|nr:IPT/TIG domain-containing protein [Niastella soli]MBO9202712.1 IPT/TIG domain-containing protein [Niastella soli]